VGKGSLEYIGPHHSHIAFFNH